MATEPQESKTPEAKKNLVFRDFGGVNTQAARQVIKNNEFSWLENAMPIGHGNLATIPAPSAGLLKSVLGSRCFYMKEGNLANVSYMFMFCLDGSAYQVNLINYTVTTVGLPGTFSGVASAITQWEDSNICIIDTSKGYFTWNGSALTTYKGTVASVAINAAGIGFTNATTTTITPSGGSPTTPTTFTCDLSVNLATIVGTGTNYAANDVLTLSGGTFTIPATLTVSAVTAGGVISGFNLTTPGQYTVVPGGTVAVTGGHGTSATFTLVFGIQDVYVATPGVGYTSAPTLAIGGAGAGTGASLTVDMNITASGTCIATYEGRVWIGFNRTIIYSAPDSFSDFNPLDLGGSLIMTDDTLKSNITSLISANNYLYVIGGSSINIISNVTVSNPTATNTGVVITPAVTTFSNTNISPSIGTEMATSIVAFYRTLAFVVDYGVMGLTGSTPQKMSDPLDGLFKLLDFTNDASGGQCVINNILCLCYLVQYKDPINGERPLLLIYFNKKWFFASQGNNLIQIASASPDPDVSSLYATDGVQLFKLFSNNTAVVAQTIQGKLWDMGNPLAVKQLYKVAIEFTSPGAAYIEVFEDNGIITPLIGNWINAALILGDWENNLLQIGDFSFVPVSSSSTFITSQGGYFFTGQDATDFGNYLGFTIKSSTPGLNYIGFYMQYDLRAQWVK